MYIIKAERSDANDLHDIQFSVYAYIRQLVLVKTTS